MSAEPVVLGLDEAGVGCALGSMWACAVFLPPGAPAAVPHLADSKTLTPKQRGAARGLLLRHSHYGLGEVTAAEIDTMGLGPARRLVFHRALDDYAGPAPSRLVVDGDLFQAWRDVPYECIPGADKTHPNVSAASILAKTQRDSQVLALCDAHPELHSRYDLRSNKGYLAPKHLAGLRQHGFSAHHRHSYRIRGLS